MSVSANRRLASDGNPDERGYTDLQKNSRQAVLFPVLLTGLVVAGSAYMLGFDRTSVNVLAFCTALALASLAIDVARKLAQKELGLDFIAALAMASGLLLGEYLASAIVAVMYAGGQFLERHAQRQAGAGMSALLAKVPHTAFKIAENGVREVQVSDIAVGDILLIRKGDILPADGILNSDLAIVSQALLTGEALPLRKNRGSLLMSGAVNFGEAFELRVARTPQDSAYAGIVNLVEAARRSKARMTRLADRYALAFLLLTIVVAGASAIAFQDIRRVVAVLVVATPCPLILAVPVALVAGTSKAARAGVLVKGAAALEALAGISIVVFDKTGTLTTGEPVVSNIEGEASADEILRLAASLDQASGHIVAHALAAEAHKRGLRLSRPTQVSEMPGAGIRGLVDGVAVSLGGDSYFGLGGSEEPPALEETSKIKVRVYVDRAAFGVITLEDRLRDEITSTIHSLRAIGISRLILASGDNWTAAKSIAEKLGFDEVRAQLTPAGKVDVLKEQRTRGRVLMVGDGVNDAPALAVADVGMAVGSSNLAAAAEAADVVLVRDDLRCVVAAIEIARRSRSIALQSAFAGMALSVAAMAVAGLGFLPPVAGALLQELIDVVVVLNALRARL
ncbi:heavy metal translocating P-type ATPase [Mycoplana rhizolycopersici]|uniref:P-type Zn(2+) transporter n=1 Tax=Mycoplana rhizolycopersici TaxID=2746702 RepID=A0ABX2QP31_9HYPH|nr:heavy metal translocating P-type ATPase [Rhizobium rhizolycopersici]NVP58652.1 cadmium-translocating P-type ATPase [Rhizobium rhizolycopersici]